MTPSALQTASIRLISKEIGLWFRRTALGDLLPKILLIPRGMLAPLSSWMKVVRCASGPAAVAVLVLVAPVVCARVLMCLCAQQWIVFLVAR